MNPRPPGYEPDELPDCSTPRYPSKAIRSDGTNNYITSQRLCQPLCASFSQTPGFVHCRCPGRHRRFMRLLAGMQSGKGEAAKRGRQRAVLGRAPVQTARSVVEKRPSGQRHRAGGGRSAARAANAFILPARRGHSHKGSRVRLKIPENAIPAALAPLRRCGFFAKTEGKSSRNCEFPFSNIL